MHVTCKPLVHSFAAKVIFFCLLFVLCFVLCAHAQEWKTYSYASEGFSVSMPSEPQFSQRDVPSEKGSFQLRSYIVSSGQMALYVGVCDYGSAAAGADPQQQLQGAKEGALQNSNSHLLREKKIALGIYPGVEIESETNVDPSKAPGQQMQGHYYARIYIVGTTIYQMIVVTAIGTPYPDTQRFLNSFQLIPRVAQ
jgi:hypothetical protein